MKKILSSAVVLFLSIFLVLSPINTAVAAETGPFYVGVLGGYTFGSDAELEMSPYKFDLDIQETWAVGAKVGYTPPAIKFFAVEFEYLYLNPDVDRTVLASLGSDFVAVEGDLKLHNFMLNLLAKYPEGNIHPYLGVGIGFSRVDLSGTGTMRIGGVTETESLDDDDTSFAWQILAGINFEISKNWSADITYRYFMTEPEFDGADLEIKTSMVTIGLNYHF
jgi:opacity protein-like surface antigen